MLFFLEKDVFSENPRSFLVNNSEIFPNSSWEKAGKNPENLWIFSGKKDGTFLVKRREKTESASVSKRRVKKVFFRIQIDNDSQKDAISIETLPDFDYFFECCLPSRPCSEKPKRRRSQKKFRPLFSLFPVLRFKTASNEPKKDAI